MRWCGYEVLEKLGEGAFADVWRISWGDRPAVLKRLKVPTAVNRDRLGREARMLSRHADNPYVLDLYHADVEGPEPHIIVEYCDGGSLDKLLEAQGPWAVPNVVRLLQQMVIGLNGIHGVNGFHRDIKPANLLFLRNGRDWIVKLGDFGLARQPAPGSDTMTAAPHGTPAYMPVEALRGGEWTPAGDVYSLGITVIEMLTGSREVEGVQGVECPQWLRTLLVAMTQEKPSERPTIRRVGEYIQANLAPKPPQPRPAPVAARPNPAPAAARPNPAPAPGGGNLFLAGLAVLTTVGAALSTMNTKDANGRYRGSDGKFRSGRWD